jgi:hypothetical protein
MIIKWIRRFTTSSAASKSSAPAQTADAALAPAQEAAPSFNQTPDYPQSFGYKVSWFALKASDPVSVLDALEIGDATPSNWESGLAAVYSRGGDDWVFVSPPISGWVLAVSTSWTYSVAADAESQTEWHREPIRCVVLTLNDEIRRCSIFWQLPRS